MERKLYQAIASTVDAMHRCDKGKNHPWSEKHRENLRLYEQDLPSGSGIDSGTKILEDESTGDKIVLETAFHHMNDGGMYDGWTEHRITIRPSMIHGIVMTLSGRNRNDIKEYLYETFDSVLNECES